MQHVLIDQIIDEQMRRAKTEPNTEFYDTSSVIVQDPSTGEILAMVSTPSYKSNEFVMGVDKKYWNALFSVSIMILKQIL